MKQSAVQKSFWGLPLLSLLGAFVMGPCLASEVIPQFKDFLSLDAVYNPKLSHNGRFALYSVRQTLWEENRYQTQLWLINVKQGDSYQLTFTDNSYNNVRWSPDDKFITFLAARDGNSQVWSISAAGGKSTVITSSKTDIGGYEWSPNGKFIAYVASDEKGESELELEEKYGSFDVIDEGFNVNHLWLHDLTTGNVIKLVDREDLNVSEISWSPNSEMIAFSATPDTSSGSFSKSNIFVVDLENNGIRTLVDQFGPDNSPTWSPDNKTIAFTSSPGTESYSATVDIFTIPSHGGPIVPLTRAFDEDVDIVAWKSNGIFFTAYSGMSHHLFLLDPARGRIEQITQSDDFDLDGVSLSSDGKKVAFVYQNSQNIKELYFSMVEEFEPERLTDFSQKIKNWKLSEKETIKWESADGLEITGVLSKPVDFDVNQKYPLFVFIHGGPEDVAIPYKIDPWNRYYPLLQLVEKGAIILQPNYRGSAGFGEKFRNLNYRNLGVGSYEDIISGVDFLITKGFVDDKRVAAMGWSQGGYLSAFAACYGNRFKAVSAGGVTGDWETYYSTTDLPDSVIHYLGATPWEDPAIFEKTSPISYIDDAKTPILLQNGEYDNRVPVANALQLYRALKSKHIPTKLIIYKNSGHGISRPKENLAVLTHNWQWFSEYIWDE